MIMIPWSVHACKKGTDVGGNQGDSQLSKYAYSWIGRPCPLGCRSTALPQVDGKKN